MFLISLAQTNKNTTEEKSLDDTLFVFEHDKDWNNLRFISKNKASTIEKKKSDKNDSVDLIDKVDKLQTQVNDLTNKVNDLTTENQNLKDQINDLTNKVNSLTTKVNSLTTENQNLRDQINDFTTETNFNTYPIFEENQESRTNLRPIQTSPKRKHEEGEEPVTKKK